MKKILKIATHNSATGEKPGNILSWLLLPFCRTQSKTIKEQYEAECRMFDLRIRKYKEEWRLAHGPFVTERRLTDVLSELNNFPEPCYIMVSYEGMLKTKEDQLAFLDTVHTLMATYSHVIWGDVIVKYTDGDAIVDWKVLERAPDTWPRVESKFLGLNGKNWQTYIPIPWLWKKIYYNKVEFNSDYFTMVDFL